MTKDVEAVYRMANLVLLDRLVRLQNYEHTPHAIQFVRQGQGEESVVGA